MHRNKPNITYLLTPPVKSLNVIDRVTPLSLVTIATQKYYPTACCSGSPIRSPANSDVYLQGIDIV